MATATFKGDFNGFVSGRLGTKSWAVFINSGSPSEGLYDRPLTKAQFLRLKLEFILSGGDPSTVYQKPAIGVRNGL